MLRIRTWFVVLCTSVWTDRWVVQLWTTFHHLVSQGSPSSTTSWWSEGRRVNSCQISCLSAQTSCSYFQLEQPLRAYRSKKWNFLPVSRKFYTVMGIQRERGLKIIDFSQNVLFTWYNTRDYLFRKFPDIFSDSRFKFILMENTRHASIFM